MIHPRRELFFKAAAAMGIMATGIRSIRAQAQSQTRLPPPDAQTLTLSRATFGVTSSELKKIQRKGRKKWIEKQLNWQSIDDSEVTEVLQRQTPTVFMSTAELAAIENGFQVGNQLKQATLYRAAFSKRQLYEVMVDFWTNHFNIYHRDGPVIRLKTIDDREVIRPHALGSFRQLLHASSKSPAMLLYLDNVSNVKGTPNENYARELMELHTLGVDGGYTETDVQEVARCFTGWGIGRGRRFTLGEFRFDPKLHDDGAKTVLQHDIPAGGGITDGEQVIDWLAGHPSTARFISTKLARHFVSDTPPETLVERLTDVFTATDGDIAQLMYTLLMSEEFLNSADAKFKRPMEYMVSAVRNTVKEAGTRSYKSMRSYLFAMGQIPFEWTPPDGYPDVADYWLSTNGLLNRWNFSAQLAGSNFPGLSLDYERLLGGSRRAGKIVDHLTDKLLHRRLLESDRAAFIRFMEDGIAPGRRMSEEQKQERGEALIGLMLASPYFQYR